MTDRILWELYVDDVVRGIRANEGPTKLAQRLNAKFRLTLKASNLVTALQAKDSPFISEGPLRRLIRERYPREAAQLFENLKQHRGGRRPVPRWKQRLTPEQERAYRELSELPTAAMAFSCTVLVLNEKSGIEEACGKKSSMPYCREHRALGRRLMTEELVGRVRRVA